MRMPADVDTVAVVPVLFAHLIAHLNSNAEEDKVLPQSDRWRLHDLLGSYRRHARHLPGMVVIQPG